MSLVVVLFAVGIVLMAIEVVIPGGFLAILSSVALLTGVVVAFTQLGGTGGLIASGVAILMGAGTLYFEFVVLPKTRLAKTFSMAETVSGRSQPQLADPAKVVGQDAVAVTTLAPSGYVELAGTRYEAYSQSGLIEAGAQLRIIAVDTFRLVVTQIKETS